MCQVYLKDELSFEYKNSGIIFENLGIGGKYEFAKAVSMFRRIIQKHRPAIVIATLMRAEIIARIACKMDGIPILGTFVNDTYSLEAINAVPLLLRAKIRFFQLINIITAKYCKAFIANSEAIKQSNARALKINLAKISVIHRGRDISSFEADTFRRINMPFHFVNVGRLLERKGQMDLIRAFAAFDKQYPGCTLSIAGDGPFKKDLENEIQHLNLLGKVVLMGNVKDIPALLKQADCFVFPSHYEGFSGALVEAALAGIPVIASNIPMNTEVIPEDSCLYFNVKDPFDLASKLMQFVLDPGRYQKMADHFRKEAKLKFDIENIVAAHEQLYANYSSRPVLEVV